MKDTHSKPEEQLFLKQLVIQLPQMKSAATSILPMFYFNPAFAAMHGPHSLVRIGPGCADRA